jgi:serine phosphatase RsbU (regulator of sigma subunit)
VASPASVTLTSTESFRLRAQQGESRRTVLWIGVLGITLLTLLLRRAMGGAVASTNAVFWPSLILVIAAMAAHGWLLVRLRRANRVGTLLHGRLWPIVATSDVVVVAGLLAILAFESPRGALTALSPPALLLLPLVTLLSILRLRPTLTLLVGLLGAVLHALLVARAFAVADAPANLHPLYWTYPAVLAMIGVAGMLVARDVRRHVEESLREAGARAAAEQEARTLQRDMSIARDIQQRLLPAAPPDFDGFELAGMNRPADLTGGDYYDWQLLPDGRLLAVLADVSGHGIGPALVMAICRAYARASADLVHDPEPLMRRLNALLQADLPADRFITLAIAMIGGDGDLRLLSAGHGPTLLYRARDRRVEHFVGDGLPLGISQHESYEPARHLHLEPGDVLVLLTDGFHEWHRAGDREPFGLERLEATLVASADRDARGILQAIDDGVRAFVQGAAQEDDMTAIVIRRASRQVGRAESPVAG